jgi:hypothetical protein
MWAMLIMEVDGNPPSVTANVAAALVMLPAESFVVFSVMLTTPFTVDSTLVIGGTSLAGDSDAVNMFGPTTGVGAGVPDDELPQPAVSSANPTARTDRRFISDSP